MRSSSNGSTWRFVATSAVDDREALEAFDLVGRAPDRAVRVERHQRAADARADVADDIVAAEHVRGALVVDRGGGEHDAVGAVDRVDQRVVVVDRSVGSVYWRSIAIARGRAAASRSIRSRLLRARERPAQLQLAERRLVDLRRARRRPAARSGRAARKRASTVSSSSPRPTPTCSITPAVTAASAATASQATARARQSRADHVVLSAGPDADASCASRSCSRGSSRASTLNSVLSQRSSTIHFVPVLTALP